jgi:1,2-diacylglycerol 3-beta-glucosyltransferase
MMTTIQLYVLFPLLIYSICIFCLFAVTILKKDNIPIRTDSTLQQNISVIIPFKNEEVHLPGLLDSISRMEYAGEVEFIFIDDESDDRSANVIRRYRHTVPYPVRVLPTNYDKNVPLTRKQQALDYGISNARFDVLAFTDADMHLHPNWLSSLEVAMHSGIDMVYGHTVIAPRSSLFSWIQAMQLEFLFSVAAGFERLGIIGSCMGNNMLLNKSAYLETGGFYAIGYTITEDRALLRHFRQHHRKTGLGQPFFPIASTPPHTSFTAFLQQLQRWAQGGFTNGINLLLFGILFSIQNLSLSFVLINPVHHPVSLLFFSNFLLTWLFIAASFHRHKAQISSRYFIFFYVILLIETILLPLLIVLKRNSNWKGSSV